MSEQQAQGVIGHADSVRRTDYLYRLSIKCLIRNPKGEVLLVQEDDRDWWDLPGGGMDHGEDFKAAIARELHEEVNLSGDFTYKIIQADKPAYLAVADCWQVRLIFEVKCLDMNFSPGKNASKVAFIHPDKFKDSDSKTEHRIYEYARIASNVY